MKDTVKRLKFRKESISVIAANEYDVFCNADENEDSLDISIHQKNLTTADLKKNKKGEVVVPWKIDFPRSFSIKINNQNITLLPPFAQENIIIRQIDTLGSSFEAIYQFSLNFGEFSTNENSIILFDLFSDEGISPSNREIASIGFFAEMEDNFKNVRLERPGTEPTNDENFWDKLISRIKEQKLKFADYEKFIDKILCKDENLDNKNFHRSNAKNRSSFIKSEEYNLIKFATDFYMAARLGLDTRQLSAYTQNTGRLPYYDLIIDRIRDDVDLTVLKDECLGRETERIFFPIMIELIWNYWMEQGMLVQTMNVINLRFQNIKGNFYADRLQRFDADPLRPLSHILWGYIQDEQHRLSIPRRLNEYDHEYGLTLTGRAVPRITPVDTRVKFLEAFHSLLTQCTIYFKESDDTTRIADAFPILNSLKEVHLLLAEGNHNAYGNLTWTARQEMMMQQYILSRTEMREFLGGRVMVPYPETWMDRVDTMRNLQGWGGTGIVHYYELAIHGELLLLSIRYGNWSDVNLDGNNAANWAQKFRNSVQRYIHAYRSVTGIDMSVDQIVQLPGNFAAQPAYLIQQRLLEERSRTRRA
jgi:hypothetical protein